MIDSLSIRAALWVALLIAFTVATGCSNKNAATSVTLYRSGEIEAALPQGWELFEDDWLVPNHRLITFEIPGGGTALISHYLPHEEDGVEVPDINEHKRGFLELWVMHPDGYGAVRKGGKVKRGSYTGEFVAIEPVPERKIYNRFEFFGLDVNDTRNFISLDIPAPIRKQQREEVEAFLASIKIHGQGLPKH